MVRKKAVTSKACAVEFLDNRQRFTIPRRLSAHGFSADQSPLPGKKLPNDRAKKFGTSCINENIAPNGDYKGAIRGWFLSPGHHKAMFSYRYKVIGYGIHGRHLTQNFR